MGRLGQLKQAFEAGYMTQARYDATCQAVIDTFAQPAGAQAAGGDSVAAAVRDLADTRRQPYRDYADPLFEQHKQWMVESDESVKAKYVTFAASDRLTPWDVMAGAYFFCGVAELKEFTALMIHQPSYRERVKAYNFLMARRMGPLFLQTNGALLLTMEWPLFPPHPRLDGQNLKLLDEMRAQAVSGGGREQRAMPSVYRDPKIDRNVTGGALSPIVQMENGQYAADVTNVEQAFLSHDARLCEYDRIIAQLQHERTQQAQALAQQAQTIANLSRHVSTIGQTGTTTARARSPPRQQQAHPQQQYTQQQQYPQQQYQQQVYAPQPKRGRGRGRAYGGEAEAQLPGN